MIFPRTTRYQVVGIDHGHVFYDQGPEAAADP